MKVHLFVPCLVDQAAPLTAHATVRLLEKRGYEVVFDRRQTCCGQALYNAGFRPEARALAERFISIFASAQIVVSPSGSCVSMVVNHYADLGLTGSLVDDYNYLKTRVFELAQFLALPTTPQAEFPRFPHSVVYHPSCHLTRDLGVITQPLDLIAQVPEIRLGNEDLPVECCGFGGAFSVKYGGLSRRIADRRAIALTATGAEYVCGGDDSCLGNLKQAFSRIGSPMKTIHYARILAGEES